MSRVHATVSWLSVPVRDAAGAVIGRLNVDMDEHGDPPRVVRDQYGATWLLDSRPIDLGLADAVACGEERPRYAFYRRVVCADGTLEVAR